MNETAEKSRAWRWVEGTILTLGLYIPVTIVAWSVLDPVPAMVAGFVLSAFFAWWNV